jgi:hypothetical protein
MVLAHAGHWAVQLLYLAPVFLIIGIGAWSKLQVRRGNRPTRDRDKRRSSD